MKPNLVKKLERLEKELSRLEKALSTTSEKQHSALQRPLRVNVETTLNTAKSIITSIASKTPITYEDIANILKESGLLRLGAAQAIAKLAELKSVIVHLYVELNHENRKPSEERN